MDTHRTDLHRKKIVNTFSLKYLLYNLPLLDCNAPVADTRHFHGVRGHVHLGVTLTQLILPGEPFARAKSEGELHPGVALLEGVGERDVRMPVVVRVLADRVRAGNPDVKVRFGYKSKILYA